MTDHVKYNGENSVVIRHDQEARQEAIRESDEGGPSAECIACGERTLEYIRFCNAIPDSKVTSYCVSNGGRGCIYKMTGRCIGSTSIAVCIRCGEKN